MLVSATQFLWSEAGNFCHSVLRVLRACCSLCSQLATLRVPEMTLSAPAQVGRVSSSGTLSAAATVRTPPSIAAAKYMDIGIVSSVVTVTVSSQCRRARASLDARTQIPLECRHCRVQRLLLRGFGTHQPSALIHFSHSETLV